MTENHEHLKDARELVKAFGHNAFLTIAYTNRDKLLETNDWLQGVEAALIFKFQPKLNISGKHSFAYDETELKISGKHCFDLGTHYFVNGNK